MTTASLYELEPGQVAAAMADPTRKTALLVQFVQEDAPSPDTMKALELLQARQSATSEAFQDFEANILHPTSDWFKGRYKLDLRSWRQDAEQEEESEGESEGESEEGA